MGGDGHEAALGECEGKEDEASEGKDGRIKGPISAFIGQNQRFSDD